MAYGSLWKNCNQKRRTLDIKDKVQSCSTNRLCQLFTYHISLTYSYCSKQKLTSCVILIIPNFLTRKLEVSKLMNPDVVQNVAAELLLSSNKKYLACCTDTDSNRQWKDLENDHNSSLLLKPSNLEILVNQFNNTTPENGNNHEKIASSKYYEIDEMHNIEIPHKNKPLSLFCINTCSLNKNFDDLQHLLSCTKN